MGLGGLGLGWESMSVFQLALVDRLILPVFQKLRLSGRQVRKLHLGLRVSNPMQTAADARRFGHGYPHALTLKYSESQHQSS